MPYSDCQKYVLFTAFLPVPHKQFKKEPISDNCSSPEMVPAGRRSDGKRVIAGKCHVSNPLLRNPGNQVLHISVHRARKKEATDPI